MPKVRGDVIRRLREAKGWSQDALGAKAIVSHKTICNLEREGSKGHHITITKVAKALGITPGELIDQGDAVVPPVAPVILPADRRVNVTLTLSIPFESFDETEGLDRLTSFLESLVKAKQAIEVTNVSAGSVKVTVAVAPEDVASIARAFVEGKLTPISVSSLTLSQEFALSLVVGQALAGFLNPLASAFMSLASLPLNTHLLKQSGVKTAVTKNGELAIQRPGEELHSEGEAAPTKYPEEGLRRAIELATPDGFLPNLPCLLTIELQPSNGDVPTASDFGVRLETALAALPSSKASFSRIDPQPNWTGKLSIHVNTADELRATAYAVLTVALGQDVTLTVSRASSESTQSGQFESSISHKMHLSKGTLANSETMLLRLLAQA